MHTAVNTKEALLKRIKDNKTRIKHFGVKSIQLFGSFVKDNTVNNDSDIDLLVDFDPEKKTFDNYMDLSFFLEHLLGRKVEIVTHQSLSKYIGPHILKQAEHVRF